MLDVAGRVAEVLPVLAAGDVEDAPQRLPGHREHDVAARHPGDLGERAGKSKFHWWKDTKRYVAQVVRMALSYNPLKVFGPISLVLATLGFGKLIYDWTVHDFRLTANTLIVLFAAFQMLAIGLLADLIVRLNRPRDEVDPASL